MRAREPAAIGDEHARAGIEVRIFERNEYLHVERLR
jgi:hypothetical protein